MLSNPKNGWVDITIGDFRDYASYIRDIPNDLLNNMIFALENDQLFCLYVDAEGHSYKIISDYFDTEIITYDEAPKITTICDIDIYDLSIQK